MTNSDTQKNMPGSEMTPTSKAAQAMTEPTQVRDAAKQFAATHARELAVELMEWSDTALLRDGKLRELAKTLESLDQHHSLKLAENFAMRAALEIAAQPSQAQAAEAEACVHDWKIAESHSDGNYPWRCGKCGIAESALTRPASPVAFPYQKTFNAIAAATKIEGNAIAISVEAFKEAFGAASPVESEREGDLPKLPSHIITAIIDYGNSRADRRDGEANSDLKYAIGAIRSLLATRTGSDK